MSLVALNGMAFDLSTPHGRMMATVLAGRGAGEYMDTRTLARAGAILAIVALLATHLFSPYLNHPLGIGLLMAVAVLI